MSLKNPIRREMWIAEDLILLLPIIVVTSSMAWSVNRHPNLEHDLPC